MTLREMQADLVDTRVLVGAVSVNFDRLGGPAAIVFLVVNPVAVVLALTAVELPIVVGDELLRDLGVRDPVGVKITFFELAIAQHLCPKPARVQAVCVVLVSFSPADGPVLVLNVLAKDVRRNFAGGFGGINVNAGHIPRSGLRGAGLGFHCGKAEAKRQQGQKNP
jgi:hypothetical protein